MCAADRETGLVLEWLFKKDFLAEAEEAVDVSHDCQLLQQAGGLPHGLATHLLHPRIAIQHTPEDAFLISVD